MPPTNSFYVGPRRSRLVAKSFADIVTAAAAGCLDETQWVELKRDIPSSSKPANLELAKDLASLSVDGGVLIVGIVDANGSAGEVVGTDLTSLATRMDQVAASRVSPPLPIVIDSFLKPGDEAIGVLVVTVPASEGAPHMVDDKYWGRGATGKRVLGDGEVRRLLTSRQAKAAGFEERLRSLAENFDPGPDGEHAHGHLYLLFEPAGVPRLDLTEAAAGKSIRQLVTEAVPLEPHWSPSTHALNYGRPHPDGIAAASFPARDEAGPEEFRLQILATNDGGLKVASGGGTQPFGSGNEADRPEVLFPGYVLELVHSCAQIAGHIAATYSGYEGAWRVGLLLNQLKGILPSQAFSTLSSRSYAPFPVDEQVRIEESNSRELLEEPHKLVERLAAPLLRGLGVADLFLPYDDPKSIYQQP